MSDAILSPIISAIADAVVERLASARTERGAYTLQEAADWLGVSFRTMKGLVASCTVPSVKIAGCRRVPVADLQALESAARAQGLSLNAYLIAALEKAAESAPTVTESVPCSKSDRTTGQERAAACAVVAAWTAPRGESREHSC